MAEPTFNELMSLKDMTREKAALILLIIRDAIDPAELPDVFPQTTSWMRRCHHSPRNYEVQEHAIAELLDTTFEALDVEGATRSSFEGVKCFGIVGGYANAGDPYVATIVHSYRNLEVTKKERFYIDGFPYESEEVDKESSFEEDGWYVTCYANLLEAAEFVYRDDEEPEEEDSED